MCVYFTELSKNVDLLLEYIRWELSIYFNESDMCQFRNAGGSGDSALAMLRKRSSREATEPRANAASWRRERYVYVFGYFIKIPLPRNTPVRKFGERDLSAAIRAVRASCGQEAEAQLLYSEGYALSHLLRTTVKIGKNLFSRKVGQRAF